MQRSGRTQNGLYGSAGASTISLTNQPTTTATPSSPTLFSTSIFSSRRPSTPSRPSTSAGPDSARADFSPLTSASTTRLVPPTPPLTQQSSYSFQTSTTQRERNVLTKERKPSLSRKSSFSAIKNLNDAIRTGDVSASLEQQQQQQVYKSSFSSTSSLPLFSSSSRRRSSAGAPTTGSPRPAVPTLPPDLAARARGENADYLGAGVGGGGGAGLGLGVISPASVDSFSRMIRSGNTPVNGYPMAPPPPPPATATGQIGAPLTGQSSAPSENAIVFNHIQETAGKRIATLDYLRKAYVPTTPPPQMASC
jgi:hypothetical protein